MVLRHIKRHIKKSLVKVAAVSIVAARKVKHAVLGRKGSPRSRKARKLVKKAAKAAARKAMSKGRKVIKRVARKLR